MLAENRFLATRDGMDAWLLDPAIEGLRPVRHSVDELLRAVRPHADALGCRNELERISALSASPGFIRQLELAERHGGLPGLVRELAAEFSPG